MAKVTTLRKPLRTSKAPETGPRTETVDLSLRLLERLANLREPVGVSDLAREFASSKATIYRHLQALLLHGFVRQEPTTMRYAAGIKLFILGERLRERPRLRLPRSSPPRMRKPAGKSARPSWNSFGATCVATP